MRAGAAFLRSRPLEIGGEVIELDTAGDIDLRSLVDRMQRLVAA